MLFAVAMMVALLAMPAGEVMAAPMASHQSQMAAIDHCGAKSGTDKPHKAMENGCCAAMSLGMAVAPASSNEPLTYAQVTVPPSADPYRRGFLGEIATPPPRLS